MASNIGKCTRCNEEIETAYTVEFFPDDDEGFLVHLECPKPEAPRRKPALSYMARTMARGAVPNEYAGDNFDLDYDAYGTN